MVQMRDGCGMNWGGEYRDREKWRCLGGSTMRLGDRLKVGRGADREGQLRVLPRVVTWET